MEQLKDNINTSRQEDRQFFFGLIDQKNQNSYEASFQIYNRPRQLSVQNPVSKNVLEFPALNTTTVAQNSFYSSNINNQFTQQDFSKMSTRSQNRNKRSTSFNMGHTFYQEQSKTCNLNSQVNQQTDVQNKFFRYFKTQMRMRKDSLKQFSESTCLKQSSLSNNLIKNDHFSQKSLACQFSDDQKGLDDFTNINNEDIIDLNKNYLYEEGLDTIQDQDEIDRLSYYEIYKNVDKNYFTEKVKNLKSKKCIQPKQVKKNEWFIQEDISPWQNSHQAQNFFKANIVNIEGRSASSTPYAKQSEKGFTKESDLIVNTKTKPNTCTSKQLDQQQSCDITGSTVILTNNEENNFINLKARSQLLSDPHQNIKQSNSINPKNNEKQTVDNKEEYNFAKKNSRQIQKKIIKMLVKHQQTNSILLESQNHQENNVFNLLKPSKNKIQISEINPIKGKENMPKFYSNLANIEMKKPALPKLQLQQQPQNQVNQVNLYKPNTIIFQSNQKYKSLFDNSSHNFNECITFLPKNIKNKILKQLVK